jgi:poly(ADP-ribose) glycohydrolase ARH3
VIPLEDRFTGSLLGLALRDALGARHEGGPLGQAAWWGLGLGGGGALRWSDDTEMAVGPAKSLVEHRGLDPDALARSWAEGADWTRGYGPGARRLLARIRDGEDWRMANRAVFPDGSLCE